MEYSSNLGGKVRSVLDTSLILAALLISSTRSIKRKKQPDILQRAKINIRHFQLLELEKATKNFSRECLVGSGAFGNVYKGTFEDVTLAIKRAHADSYQTINEFRNG